MKETTVAQHSGLEGGLRRGTKNRYILSTHFLNKDSGFRTICIDAIAFEMIKRKTNYCLQYFKWKYKVVTPLEDSTTTSNSRSSIYNQSLHYIYLFSKLIPRPGAQEHSTQKHVLNHFRRDEAPCSILALQTRP